MAQWRGLKVNLEMRYMQFARSGRFDPVQRCPSLDTVKKWILHSVLPSMSLALPVMGADRRSGQIDTKSMTTAPGSLALYRFVGKVAERICVVWRKAPPLQHQSSVFQSWRWPPKNDKNLKTMKKAKTS